MGTRDQRPRQRPLWLRVWLEDVSGDGHVDVVREEELFAPGCRCEDLRGDDHPRSETIRSWAPPPSSRWSFSDLYCTGGSRGEGRCSPATKTTRKVLRYDPRADRWR